MVENFDLSNKLAVLSFGTYNTLYLTLCGCRCQYILDSSHKYSSFFNLLSNLFCCCQVVMLIFSFFPLLTDRGQEVTIVVVDILDFRFSISVIFYLQFSTFLLFVLMMLMRYSRKKGYEGWSKNLAKHANLSQDEPQHLLYSPRASGLKLHCTNQDMILWKIFEFEFDSRTQRNYW